MSISINNSTNPGHWRCWFYRFQSYKCDNYYSPANESGIRYDEPILKIDWLLDKSQIKLSEKDSKHACFEKSLAAKYFQYDKII